MIDKILIVGRNDYKVTAEPLAKGDITGYSPCTSDIALLVEVLDTFSPLIDVVYADFDATYDVDEPMQVDVPHLGVCKCWGTNAQNQRFDTLNLEKCYDLVICYDIALLPLMREMYSDARIIYRSMYDDCSPRGGFYGSEVNELLKCADAMAVNSEFAKSWFLERFMNFEPPIAPERVYVWKLGYSDEAINKTFDALAGIVGDVISTRHQNKVIIAMSNLSSSEQVDVVITTLNRIVARFGYEVALYVMHPPTKNYNVRNIGFEIESWPSDPDSRQELLGCSDLFVSMWKPGFSGGDFFAAEAAALGCNIVAAKTAEWHSVFPTFGFFTAKEFYDKMVQAIECVLNLGGKLDADVRASISKESVEYRAFSVDAVRDDVWRSLNI